MLAAPLSAAEAARLPRRRAYRRVSYRKRDVLFFVLIPIWALVISWKVGFRLASLPYPDWPPRPDEQDRCRRILGTAYHVVSGSADHRPEPSPSVA